MEEDLLEEGRGGRRRKRKRRRRKEKGKVGHENPKKK